MSARVDADNPHEVFGMTRAEAARRVGDLRQIARIDSFTEEQGPARGARRLRMVTGGGLEAEIHPDRALDIGQVTFRGVPVAWMSPTGIGSPSFAEPLGTGWLRTFGGGLLATCGLDTFGPPTRDAGVDYPMHGRVGATPATLTRAELDGDCLTVAGQVRQATVFGENLVLRRIISAAIGGRVLRVEDTVTNEGMRDAVHLVLYHCNLGWPLLDTGATLDTPPHRVTPRDVEAEQGLDRWHRIEPPQDGYAEQVFLHDFAGAGVAEVSIDNPAVNTRFTLRYDTATLPGMCQWKMCGEGHYALGLEPVNVLVAGRALADDPAVLPVLPRGASVRYALEFEFSQSRA